MPCEGRLTTFASEVPPARRNSTSPARGRQCAGARGSTGAGSTGLGSSALTSVLAAAPPSAPATAPTVATNHNTHGAGHDASDGRTRGRTCHHAASRQHRVGLAVGILGLQRHLCRGTRVLRRNAVPGRACSARSSSTGAVVGGVLADGFMSCLWRWTMSQSRRSGHKLLYDPEPHGSRHPAGR
jgi:hypothetical protein